MYKVKKFNGDILKSPSPVNNKPFQMISVSDVVSDILLATAEEIETIEPMSGPKLAIIFFGNTLNIYPILKIYKKRVLRVATSNT